MTEPIDPCRLVAHYGPKIRTAPPGYNWYRHDTYSYHDGEQLVALPGRIQVRYQRGRTDVLTLDDQGAAVRGYNLPWLIQQAGFQPAPGTNAIPL